MPTSQTVSDFCKVTSNLVQKESVLVLIYNVSNHLKCQKHAVLKWSLRIIALI